MERNRELNKIVRPSGSEVLVGNGANFTYIMRTDTKFAIDQITHKVKLNDNQKEFLGNNYDYFVSELHKHLLSAFSLKGFVELHLFDPETLDSCVRSLSKDSPVVSLDPLTSEGVHSLKISRSYCPGGIIDMGQVARPGSVPLDEQAKNILSFVKDEPVVVVEDDIFSGESLIKGLIVLMNAGINIKSVVPGIQIGYPTALQEMGIEVNPAVKYLATEGKDIFDLVDLGDPRDFLVGIDGLVARFPSGNFGRLPYILPYVSPSARVGIPASKEVEFSMKLLKQSRDFYKVIQDEYMDLKLSDINPFFAVSMKELHGMESETSMVNCIELILSNFENIQSQIREFGEKRVLL